MSPVWRGSLLGPEPLEVNHKITARHYHEGDRLVDTDAAVESGEHPATEESSGFSWIIVDFKCIECGQEFQVRIDRAGSGGMHAFDMEGNPPKPPEE